MVAHVRMWGGERAEAIRLFETVLELQFLISRQAAITPPTKLTCGLAVYSFVRQTP